MESLAEAGLEEEALARKAGITGWYEEGEEASGDAEDQIKSAVSLYQEEEVYHRLAETVGCCTTHYSEQESLQMDRCETVLQQAAEAHTGPICLEQSREATEHLPFRTP